MKTHIFLLTIFLLFAKVTARSQTSDIEQVLTDLITATPDSIEFNSRVKTELEKLELISSYLSGNQIDTFFNKQQTGLYRFFKEFLRTQQLPINRLDANEFADYSVRRMKFLESQRKSAETFYDHVKNDMGLLLFPDAEFEESRKVLDGLELLGRSLTRLIVEMDDINRIEGLKNKLSDSRVKRILKGVQRIGRKSEYFSVQNIQDMPAPAWIGDNTDQFYKFINDINILMKQTDLDDCSECYEKLKSLMRFQEYYQKFVGTGFAWTLENADTVESIKLDRVEGSLDSLKTRWIEIQNYHLDYFAQTEDGTLGANPTTEEALAWLLTDLKNDYFELRKLFRELDVVEDVEGKVSVITAFTLKNKMKGLVDEWNQALYEVQIELDTTRESLHSVVKTILPDLVNEYLANQLKQLENTTRKSLLSSIGVENHALDSLVLEKSQLDILLKTSADYALQFRKIASISSEPDLLKGYLSENFQFTSKWKSSDSVQYILIEKSALASTKSGIGVNHLTGVSTDWIVIPDPIWGLSLTDFEELWGGIVKDIGLTGAESELNLWLSRSGFPGDINLSIDPLELSGGIPFQWLGRNWNFSFTERRVDVVDTLEFDINSIRQKDFWVDKARQIGEDYWIQFKPQLEDSIKAYWSGIMPFFNGFELPERISPILRSDELLYQIDLGTIDGLESLSGASVLIAYNGDSLDLDYNLPISTLASFLNSRFEVIKFKDIRESEGGVIASLELHLMSELHPLGEVRIKDNGELELNSDIEMDIDLFDNELEFEEVEYGNGVLKFTGEFKRGPISVEFERRLEKLTDSDEFDLVIQYMPELNIALDEISNSVLCELLTENLQMQGLLPLGLSIESIEIDQNGIYPQINIDQEKIKNAIRADIDSYVAELEKTDLARELKSQFEEYSLQAIELERNIRASIDGLENDAQRILNDLIVEFSSGSFDRESLNDLYEQVESGVISLDNGTRVFLKERRVEFTSPFFGCEADDKGKYDPYLYLNFNNHSYEIGRCLKDYIETFFEENLDSEEVNIISDIENKRLIVEPELPFPLKMFIYTDGAIGWNYNQKEVQAAVLNKLEEEAKKLAEKSGIDPYTEVNQKAVELLDSWNEFFVSIGFKISNIENLRGEIEKVNSFSKLRNTKLNATLYGVEGLGKDITIRNVELELDEALIPDFQNASAELDPLYEKFKDILPEEYIEIEAPVFSRGIISTNLILSIPDIPPISLSFQFNIQDGKLKNPDWKGILATTLNTLFNKRLKGYEIGGEDISLLFVQSNVEGNEIIVDSRLIIDAGLDDKLMADADLILNLDSKKFDFRVGSLDDQIGLIVKRITKLIGIAIFGENDFNPRFYYPEGGVIPRGLIVKGRTNLWETVEIITPDIIVSSKGIDIDETSGFGIEFKEGDVPVPPFRLTDPSGNISGSEITIAAKLTLLPPKSEDMIYAKGSFMFDFDNPFKWTSRTDLVALRFLNLGYSQQEIDLKESMMYAEIDLGGPLKDIISVEGEATINAKKVTQPIIDIAGNGKIFGESVGQGKVKIDLDNHYLEGWYDLTIPVVDGGLEGYLRTEKNFSNPTIGASRNISLGGFDLAGTRFRINPSVASSQFSVLGISMGLSVPSYRYLTKDAFLELLKDLLSPNFDNLDEALLALLNGNFNINPFSGFGPGGGGIAGDGGDGGDGGSSGSNGGGDAGYDAGGAESEIASQVKGTSAGTIQSEVQVSKTELSEIDAEPVDGGKEAYLMPKGEFYYQVIKDENSNFRVVREKQNEPNNSVLLSFLPQLETISGHFKKIGDKYYSEGLVLGAYSNYYVHILKQGLDNNLVKNGVLHLYKGPEVGNIKHLEVPLVNLEPVLGPLIYGELSTTLQDQKKANWMRSFSASLANRSEFLNSDAIFTGSDKDIILFSSENDVLAAAFRFYNELDYNLIVTNNEGTLLNVNISDLDLIINNGEAKKNFIALVKKHQQTDIGLYTKDDQIFVYTGCDLAIKKKTLYKLVGSDFTVESTEDCEPIIPSPSEEPEQITEPPKPIPPQQPPLKPGDGPACSWSYQTSEDNEFVTISCGSLSFEVPRTYEGQELVLNNAFNSQVFRIVEPIGYGSILKILITLPNNERSFIWLNPERNPSGDFTISEMKFDDQDIPSWSRLNPSANQGNEALQGAFDELSSYTSSLVKSGSKIEKLEYFNKNGIDVFVVRYDNMPENKYWVFAGNQNTLIRVTGRYTSEDVTIFKMDSFIDHLKSRTQ